MQMFFLLCHSGSPIRHTFLPSNLTSNEYIMYSHTPLKVEERIPPIEPGSSPMDMEYCAPFTIGIWPSVFTDEGPDEVSAALPVFG